MERVAAMASVSAGSTTSSLLAATTRGKQANMQGLASCRALSRAVKLRGALGVRVVKENAVVRVVSKQAAVSTPMKENAMEKEVYDCVVVGAGISGLCTAQAFATRYTPIACICTYFFVFMPAFDCGVNFKEGF